MVAGVLAKRVQQAGGPAGTATRPLERLREPRFQEFSKLGCDPTLVSECDFFVQFWRTRKRPNQFADAMRDAERLRDGGRVEKSESAGRGDHRPLGKFLGIPSQGSGFEPAKEDARRIDGIHSGSCGDYSISDSSTLLHKVQRMPIGKERVQSFMGIEGDDVGLHAAHALKGARRAAMQSGMSSANTSVLKCGRQCIKALFLRDRDRGRYVQA